MRSFWLGVAFAFLACTCVGQINHYAAPEEVPEVIYEQPHCDAGGYLSTTCVNHHIAIGLSASNSNHFTSVQWSVSHPKFTLNNPTSVTPILKIKSGEYVCDDKIVVSLTVKNHDGRKDSCSVEVGVSDHTKPVFPHQLDDVTVECDDIPTASYVSAKDDCDKNVNVVYSESEDSTHAGYILWREWIAMDVCGNAAQMRQKVTVVDSLAPELVGVDADTDAPCDNIPKPCAVVAFDNCDDFNEVELLESTIDGTCEDEYKIVRCWTTTDNAYNGVEQCQTISVSDDVPPTLAGLPADRVTYGCDAVPSPGDDAVTAFDNCDDDVHIHYSGPTIPGPCPHQYQINRNWDATDDCGNTASFQSIAQILAETPVISDGGEENVEINCDEDFPLCEPEVSDPCDYGIELKFDEDTVPGTCVDEYTIYRVWKAENLCGEEVERTQTINVVDNNPPKFITHPPQHQHVACDNIPQYDVQAVDNCDDDVDVDPWEHNLQTVYNNNYEIDRRWTATDNCGHTDVITQKITVSDLSPPTLLGVPPPLTVECDNVPPMDKDTVTIHDECDCLHFDVVYEETPRQLTCVNNYVLIRTWTGTDCSGNQIVERTTITVYDTTPPTLNALEGESKISIEEHSSHVYFSGATCDDNCGDVTPIQNADVTQDGSCVHNYHVIKSWTCEDACGHSVTKYNTVTVFDHTPPVLENIPNAYMTWECDDPQLGSYADSPILSGSVVTVTDNSFVDDGIYLLPQVYFMKKKVPGTCPENYELHLTWVSSDSCGNNVEAGIVIRVIDYQPPVLTNPVPKVITDDCNIEEGDDLVTATDNCADVTVVFEEERDYTGSDCQTVFNLRRTWSATDDCGNAAAPVHQFVEVIDTAKPVWLVEAPDDVTVDCEYEPSNIKPVANDVNCYDPGYQVPLDYSERTIFEVCNHEYAVARKWVATDCIGNAAYQTQTVYVEDRIAPVFTSSAPDATVDCFEPPIPTMTAWDNCGYAVNLKFFETQEDVECAKQFVLVRRWVATDLCGNEEELIQRITVQDNEAPVINAPSDCNVNCDEELSPDDGECTDDCSYVTTKFTSTRITGGCPHNYIVIRTWSCEDECGKTASHTQTVTVSDFEAPIFDGYVPPEITAECDNVPPVDFNIGGSDNCGYPLTGVVEKREQSNIYGDINGRYTLIRSFMIKDSCGNTATYFQTVHVDDTTPPTLQNVPDDKSIPCQDISFHNGVWAKDNCDINVDVTHEKFKENEVCEHQYIWRWVWTAVDDCGNEANAEAFIYVDDHQKPSFSHFTPSFHYTSPDVSIANIDTVVPVPHAYDNCDSSPDVQCVTTRENGCTDNDYTLTRICTASDVCGNSGYPVTQVFEVEDRDPCPFTTFPADLTIECDDDLAEAYVAPTHDCSYMTLAETVIAGTCEDENLIIKTFTITDDCGNSFSRSQTIEIFDLEGPTVDIEIGDLTFECATDTDNYLIVTDNCDYAPTQLFKEYQVYYHCAHDYQIVQEWLVKDRCQNSHVYIRTITVLDETAPELPDLPSHTTVDHLNIPIYPTVDSCSDNCDNGDTTQSFEETTILGSCEDEYTVYREWCCTDCTGTPVCDTQTIEVVDTTSPKFYSCPPDETHMSIIPMPPPTLEAGDGYGAKAWVDFDQQQGYSDYLYSQVVTRTWTAEDGCGNRETCVQQIYITEPPPILCVPDNATYDCADIDDIPSGPSVTEEVRECSGDGMVITLVEDLTVPGSCANEFCIHRKWQATDELKGSIQHNEISYTSQTICVYDTHGPTWDFDAYRTVDCSKAHLLPEYLHIHPVTAQDDCGPVTVTPCCWADTGNYGYHYDYTATDECGHTLTERMNVVVVDMEDPVLSGFPASTTVPCELPPPLDGDDLITCTDNCDPDPQLDVWQVVIEHACAHRQKVVRGWRCADNKGNVVTHLQTITVEDNNGPTWQPEMPADISIECDLDLPDVDQPEATDDCAYLGYVTYLGETHTSAASAYGSAILTVIRRWIVYDDCGQFADWTQSIFIYDTEYPVLHGVPEDSVDECSACVCASVVATDNCGAPSMHSWNVTTTGTCITEKVVVTYWEAVDDVGHSVHDSQTLVIRDTNPPEFVGYYMEDEVVDCDQVPTYVQGGSGSITAVDDCDQHVDVIFKEELIKSAYWVEAELFSNLFGKEDKPKVEYDLVRTWSATDNCGHSILKTQSISVNDRSAPVFLNCPIDVEVKCGQVPVAVKQLTIKDNCDPSPYQTYKQEIELGTCESEVVYIRTWEISDTKDNTATCIQTISVVDNDPPVWSVIPLRKRYWPCEEFHGQIDSAVATDDCGVATVERTGGLETTTCVGDYVYEYTWTAHDECGNSNSHRQTQIITDTNKPYCTVCPDKYRSLDCAETIDDVIVTFQDDCSEVTTSDDHKTLSVSCNDNMVKVFTWYASDDCGNTAKEVATVAVSDVTPPTFTELPDSTSIECKWPDGGLVAWLSVITFDDDCDGNPSLEQQHSIIPGTCEFDDTQEWTFTITDDCGNQATETRSVDFYDHTPPYFTGVPPTQTFDCDGSEPSFNVIAKDDCGGVFGYTAPVKEQIAGTCDHSVVFVYTWSATDLCGNTFSTTTTVVFEDLEAPVLDVTSFGGNFPCDDIPATPELQATDNCDPYPVIHYTSQGEGSYEISEYTVLHTWTATDACGNEDHKEILINVFDDTAPVISAVQDVTVDCKSIPPPVEVYCHDNCDAHVALDYDQSTDLGSCVDDYQLIRHWDCHDNVNLLATAEYTVTVQDTDGPRWISDFPKDQTYQCDEVLPEFNVQVEDYCDYNVEVITTPSSVGDKCLNTTTTVYTATDSCGYSISHTWTYAFEDTVAPVFSSYPPDKTIPCSEFGGYGYAQNLDAYSAIWPGIITASDNCEYDVTVKFHLDRVDGSCDDAFLFILGWSTSDDCNNRAFHAMTIHVFDDDPPQWGNIGSDYTLGDVYEEFHSIGRAIADAEAYDSCDNDVEVTGYEEKLTRQYNRDCDNEYLLVRYFTAVDNCGNYIYHTQSITAIDTEPPTLPLIDDVTMECDEFEGYADCDVIPTSEGDEDLEVTVFQTTEQFNGFYKVYKTWSVTDCAYLSATTAQTITVIDSHAPIFSRYPEDTTYECACDESMPVVKAYDNCDTVTIVPDEDCEPFDCSDDPWLINPNIDLGTDVDGEPIITYYEYVTEVCVRTWEAEDSAGNIETHTQSVIIMDTSAPEFQEQSYDDAVYECDSFPDRPLVEPICWDGCAAATVNYVDSDETPSEVYTCGTTVIHEYECLDKCGRVDTTYVTTISHDTTPPDLVDDDDLCIFPAYGQDWGFYAVYDLDGILAAIDNCGDDGTDYFQGPYICNATDFTVNGDPVSFTSVGDGIIECQVLLGKLYVKVDRNDPTVSTNFGRTYHFYATLDDDPCGNTQTVQRDIYIALDAYSHEHRQPCYSGNPSFTASLPEILGR